MCTVQLPGDRGKPNRTRGKYTGRQGKVHKGDSIVIMYTGWSGKNQWLRESCVILSENLDLNIILLKLYTPQHTTVAGKAGVYKRLAYGFLYVIYTCI